MIYVLVALFSFVAGIVACYFIMSRDDGPSEELIEAKAEAKKIVEQAEATLEQDLIPIKQAQAKLDVVKRMQDPKRQLEALEAFTNRKR